MRGIFWSYAIFDPLGFPKNSPASYEEAQRLALAGNVWQLELA
jgi:hypothetical protein